jgi:hypothetical protein
MFGAVWLQNRNAKMSITICFEIFFINFADQFKAGKRVKGKTPLKAAT